MLSMAPIFTSITLHKNLNFKVWSRTLRKHKKKFRDTVGPPEPYGQSWSTLKVIGFIERRGLAQVWGTSHLLSIATHQALYSAEIPRTRQNDVAAPQHAAVSHNLPQLSAKLDNTEKQRPINSFLSI